MNLEQQVTSLELSRKLATLGVKQDSLFYWHNIDDYPSIIYGDFTEWSGDRLISAFTIAELGEMLPLWWDSGKREEKDYICRSFEKNVTNILHAFGETEADARANMLIYLIENGLMKKENK